MSVSIITPTYNSSKYVCETINSVKSQTFQDWEMIIVDDCSQDNTIDLVEEMGKVEKRIKLISLKKNVGAAEARNIALRQATGRFITFLDSDDIWYDEKLEKQLNFMCRNNIAFSFSAYDVMSADGREKYKINVPVELSYRTYLKNTIIGCLTVMIDKEKTGYFEMPVIKSSHDMALWLALIRKNSIKAYGIQESLAKYRLVQNSNTAKKYKAAIDVWKVYRDYENLSLIYSVYNFIGYIINAIWKRL